MLSIYRVIGKTIKIIQTIIMSIIWPGLLVLVAAFQESGEREKGTRALGTGQVEQVRMTNPESW